MKSETIIDVKLCVFPLFLRTGPQMSRSFSPRFRERIIEEREEEKREALTQISGLRSHASRYVVRTTPSVSAIYNTITLLMVSISFATSESTLGATRTKGVFVPPTLTLRRSLQLAARRSLSVSQHEAVQRPGLLTPFRDSIRKFLLSGKGALTEDLKRFIDESECYRSLET